MCIVCDRINLIRRGENPYFVKELETGYVVIGDHQYFKGYTLFLCKKHELELHTLDKGFKKRYLEEMAIVAEAVYYAFGADKMNYELLGNGDAHLHWHLFPRRNGDLGDYGVNGAGPVWLYPRDKMYDVSNRPDADELQELKSTLLHKLNQLLNAPYI